VQGKAKIVGEKTPEEILLAKYWARVVIAALTVANDGGKKTDVAAL